MSDDADSADSTTADAPATTEVPMTDEASASTGTIVDVAAANDDFSTLVDLVGKAGLADALSGEGPFTVFTPTNEASRRSTRPPWSHSPPTRRALSPMC